MFGQGLWQNYSLLETTARHFVHKPSEIKGREELFGTIECCWIWLFEMMLLRILMRLYLLETVTRLALMMVLRSECLD